MTLEKVKYFFRGIKPIYFGVTEMGKVLWM